MGFFIFKKADKLLDESICENSISSFGYTVTKNRSKSIKFETEEKAEEYILSKIYKKPYSDFAKKWFQKNYKIISEDTLIMKDIIL